MAVVVGGRVSGFAIGLVLVALLVAVPVLLIARIHGFDGLYGQDAFAYAAYGLGPLREALVRGHVPPDFPLPPGYPLLVAVASLAVGSSDVVAQYVSILAGASIPVLVALLAREILPGRDTRMGLLAGLVAAIAGQLWQSSLVSMSDTPAAAAATLGALAGCRFHRTGGRAWLVLAAAALALAMETRIIYGAVALVFAAVAIERWRGDVRLDPRRALTGAGLAGFAGLVILAPAIAAIGLDLAAGRPMPFAAEFGVSAFDPTTPFRSTFETADGHLAYTLPMLAWYVIQPARWYWLAALSLGVPVGIVAVLRRHARSIAEFTTLIAWPTIAGLVLVFYPYQNPRFFLAVLPPLAILAAIGLDAAWRRLAEAPATARTIALVVAALAIGANAGLAFRYTSEFAVRQSADLAAIRALAAEIPPGAAVVSIGATPVLRHDGRQVTELYNLSAAGAEGLVRGSRIYVIVQAAAMAGQWAGTRTGEAFATIASAPGFAVVDRAGSWTLYAGGG
jgi:hypothetical protein